MQKLVPTVAADGSVAFAAAEASFVDIINPNVIINDPVANILRVAALALAYKTIFG